MAPQEDVELVRKGYDAFIGGDMEWLNEHLDDNIVWHVPGTSVLAGDYKGRENVLGFFAKSVQIALPGFEIHDILGSEDHVVALLTITWKRNDTGASHVSRAIQVFHVQTPKALEVWTMTEDQAAFDAFMEGAGT